MGCPIDCSYCVLESYLDYRAITIFTNTNDIYSELKEFLKDKKNFRIGTGELSDSLALDDITLSSTDIITHLGDNFNGFFELKTKSNNIDNLLNLKPNKKIVIGFSLNTGRMVEEFEKNSASLGERIKSAKTVSDYGYSISIHFDPIIIYEECANEYKEVIELLFSEIKDTGSIAWISLGGFRYSNELKKQIKVASSSLFSGEFVKSLDGKYRYFKPQRISLYSEIVDKINSYSKEIPIYFCMESNDVWENIFGSHPSSIKNLKSIF
jgi:spore photoproduct lyase